MNTCCACIRRHVLCDYNGRQPQLVPAHSVHLHDAGHRTGHTQMADWSAELPAARVQHDLCSASVRRRQHQVCAVSTVFIVIMLTIIVRYRCTLMSAPIRFHCGPFDLDGFATDSSVFPTPWKVSLVVLGTAALTMTLTVGCTLVSCCRQSVFGKSIHNCTGAAQVVAGIFVMVAIFCHMLGWGANRVHRLCGPEAEPFYAAECRIGKCL